MDDWLHNLPVGWMAVVFFGGAYLSAGLIYAVAVKFSTSTWVRARAFSGSMLSPMGTLFALFVVFTSAQVWNDNNRATASVAQEASALKTVLVLSAAFTEQSQGRLRTLIRSHIEESATKEWPMMALESATLEIVPRNLVEALQLTLALTPSNQGQGVAQREMVVALESALDARRQRILISQSSVNFVKWACLVIQAICVLIVIALAHLDRRSAAIIAMGLFATGAAACLLLIGAYDRPFTGHISVRPDPLLQVVPGGLGPAFGFETIGRVAQRFISRTWYLLFACAPPFSPDFGERVGTPLRIFCPQRHSHSFSPPTRPFRLDRQRCLPFPSHSE